jgi:peroxiredoxin
MAPAGGARWAMGLIVAGGLLFGLAVGALILFSAPAAPAATPLPASTAAFLPAKPVSAPPPAVGAPAADFSLADVSSQTVRLSDFKGQVVLLNFWATWCGPCQLEMPTIEKTYEAWKDQGFAVVAVEVGDPLADVQSFVNNDRLTFRVLWDEKTTVSDLYQISVLPTSFVIDRDGKIVQQEIGMLSDSGLQGYLTAAGLKKP